MEKIVDTVKRLVEDSSNIFMMNRGKPTTLADLPLKAQVAVTKRYLDVLVAAESE